MQWFTHLRLATKLVVSFCAVLALSLLIGGFSILKMHQVDRDLHEVTGNWLPSVQLVMTMNGRYSDFRITELQHVLSRDEASMGQREAEMKQLLAEISKLEAAYIPLIASPEEQQLWNGVKQSWQQYLVEHDKLLALSRANRTEEAHAFMNGTSQKLFDRADELLEQLVKLNERGAETSATDAEKTIDGARVAIIAALALTLVTGLLLAWQISKSLARPIHEAMRFADKVASGDLTTRVEVRSRDEVGQLLESLQRMNDNLARIVTQVRGASDSIATGSSQIASGNADLSQRTEEQAANLEETAASMEQLSATVRNNADTARMAAQLAASAATAATRGGDVVGQVVDTMDAISTSSRRVVDIIGVIDGIAFQTNILALNAAVEAARAGEQGRGFAVVAGEVRTLAQRSADAAKEIKSLISASVEKVEAGAHLVTEAGSAMNDIVAQVKRVNDLIGEISSATQEQTSGISQVSDAVAQLDQVTQQNAALVEESAAAATSLNHQAQSLVQAVGSFRIHAGTATTPTGHRSAPSLPTARVAAAPRPLATTSPATSSSTPTAATAPAPARATPAPSPAPVAAGNDDWETF